MSKYINNSHENYSRAEKVKISSEKNFGFTLGFIFCLIGIAPLLGGHSIRLWALILGSLFVLPAIFRPSLLKWPNVYWAKLGLFLNKVVSPIVLFILFFIVFFPIGLLLKILGKDILKLKIDKSKNTYWIKSDSTQTNMQDQF